MSCTTSKRQEQRYRSYLHGKRVALVGPASTLQELEAGDVIDSYDIVVRANGFSPLKPELYQYTGKRTDVYYTNIIIEQEQKDTVETRELEVDWVCYYQHKRNRHAMQRWGYKTKSEHRMFNTTLWAMLRAQVGAHPHTGMVAMTDIFISEPKELYITGMTFYRDGYMTYMHEYRTRGRDRQYKQWARKSHKKHDTDAELAMTARLYKQNENVTVDPILKLILEDELHRQKEEKNGE